MLQAAPVIAFIPSGDLDRSRRFYADVLGLTVDEVTPFACVLDVGATMVRITKVEDLRPQPFTVLGWRTIDIEGEATSLVTAGVEFIRYQGMEQDSLGVWTAPGGDRIAWFHDPDGNTLSLTQFAAR